MPGPLLVLLVCVALLPGDDDLQLHRRYGFDGLVVSRFNDGLFGLTAGDLDGDGHGDLAVINNSKARIELLLHGEPDEPELDPDLANELPDEAFFRRESVATEQRVWDLALADLDGDQRADIVMTGDSGELTVVWAGDDAAFEQRGEWPLERGRALRGSIATGDLDGDGRPDLAILTEQAAEIFLTDVDGVPRPARSLPLASSAADGFDLVDLDGDGRLDLLFVVSESSWPLRWRLGQGGADFGPERAGELPALRSFTSADLDGDGADEVLAVARRSGRVQHIGMRAPDDDAHDALALSAPRQLPFEALKDATGREGLLADLDRDGHPDLLVAEPSAARLVLYRGASGGQFRPGEPFPSLLGSSRPRLADLDGDGVREIVLAAPAEGALAVARLDELGRPAFPEVLGPTGEDVLGLAVGDADGDGDAEAWAVLADGRGRRRDYRVTRFDADAAPRGTPLELPGDPSDVLMADLDRDGRDDLLVFLPTEKPVVLLARAPDGEGDGGEGDDAPAVRWQRVDADTPGLGVLEGVTRASLDVTDVDGDGLPELLVPAGNFARALHLDAEGRPQVVTQVNLADPSGKVVAVAAADLDGDGRAEFALAEQGGAQLLVLDGQGRELARVDTADLAVDGIDTTDLDGDGRADLLLWSRDRVAALISGRRDPRLAVQGEYESPVKEAFLDALAVGDVNADGAADLVVVETNKHTLHIATLHDGELEHVLRFPVFEARLFESARRSSREPREVLVAEVTGDGLNDVAILVHDRLIVYPQEPAP